MHFSPLLLRSVGIPVTELAIALLLATAANAQPDAPALTEPARTLQASDATSPVLALPYHSVFSDLPRGVEEGNGDWTSANNAVAQFPRGHIDLLQWERARATQPKEQP
jgi:hypothetical protein